MFAKGRLAEWYVDEIENLFAIGGVKGDLTDPTALFEEVKVCFPGIREEEIFPFRRPDPEISFWWNGAYAS